MLTLANRREIQRINSIINLIDGSQEKYYISIIPNIFDSDIYVIISDSNRSKFIYYNIFHTNNDNHIETINLLRNSFIDSGVVISKLAVCPIKEKITYRYQEIFKNNLEMFIQITTEQEEVAAAKAHKRAMNPKLPIFNLQKYDESKVKTIQPEKIVG